MARPRRLVLGLGNPLAGEDAFGPAVVEALRRRPDLPGDVEIRDVGTDLLDEMDTFAARDQVLIVDAVVGLGHAGRVSVVEEAGWRTWPDTSTGAHAISPLLVVRLFRAINPAAATRFTLVALHVAAIDPRHTLPDGAVDTGVAALADALRLLPRERSPVDADTKPTATTHFQVCGSCRARWPTWDAFVEDPRVTLLGLQAVPGLPDASLLVFEHGCGSSVSILTKRLRHLLPDDPAGRDWPSLRGTEQCPGHCLSLEDLAACDRPCVNARDRKLVKIVRRLAART